MMAFALPARGRCRIAIVFPRISRAKRMDLESTPL